MKLAVVLGLAFAGIVLAQPTEPDSGSHVGRNSRKPDSGSQAAIAKRSPGRALLLSAVVPGGGQVYTGNLLKALIVAPAEVGLGYFAVREHLAAARALDSGQNEQYVRHRDQRNGLLWWTGAVVAFSMADAYVSAQMYGFERQMRFAFGALRAGFVVDI